MSRIAPNEHRPADVDDPRDQATHPTIHARIVDRLREDILSSHLPEGTFLRQDNLAARYGASRIPVREALLQLEGEGLVQQFAHKGYKVAHMSVADIVENFDLRALIESDLIARAIPHLTEADLDAARAVQTRIDGEEGQNVDARRWGELNWSFHQCLHLPAGRTRTMRILHNLHRSGMRYVRWHMSLDPEIKIDADREHHRLLKACVDRDIPEARRVMAEHILRGRDDLRVFFTENGWSGDKGA